MREKSLKLIVSFRTTTDAMAMESCCEQVGLPGRLIPIPREITANCGLSWCAPVGARQALADAAQSAQLQTDGWYELLV